MVQKTVVTVICDLPHDGGDVKGEETVPFSFDGAAYEIDVCGSHAKELRDKVAPFVEYARRASSGAGRRRRARTGPSRERSAEIRQWAKARGYKVNERGRIPASIVTEYDAAH